MKIVRFKLNQHYEIEIEKDTIFLHEDEDYEFKALYYDGENNQEMVVIEKILDDSHRILYLVVPKRIGWIV